MMSTTPSDDAVRRLRRLDACAVSDALDKLGLRGVASGLAPLSAQRRIAGRVTTVKLAPAAAARLGAASLGAARLGATRLGAARLGATPLGAAPLAAGSPPRHLCTAAIEASGPDHVIVVEQRTGIEAGSWGGILTLAAKLRGVAGVIADGLVRDVDEARQYDFAVYARGCTALTARGRVAEIGTDVPVRIGDIDVQPGDCVLADGSGVVFIAAADVDRVLDAAEAIVAREAAMARALLGGAPVTQVMGASYEHMLTRT